jgi:hypothetical protein
VYQSPWPDTRLPTNVIVNENHIKTNRPPIKSIARRKFRKGDVMRKIDNRILSLTNLQEVSSRSSGETEKTTDQTTPGYVSAYIQNEITEGWPTGCVSWMTRGQRADNLTQFEMCPRGDHADDTADQCSNCTSILPPKSTHRVAINQSINSQH